MQLKADGFYVDGTYGRGGHSRAILDALGPHGRLLALDRDPVAVEAGEKAFVDDPRASIVHCPFSELLLAVQRAWGDQQVDGILLDLGVSSPQLDEAERGFSFRQNGPLDMRMDTTQQETAATWLAKASEQTIADVLYTLGEERQSRKIAKHIVHQRRQQPFTTTAQLAQCVVQATGAKPGRKHPATRTFQAIRMHINQELSELETGLAQSVEALAAGGRLCVIAFHSIEDRIVKHFFRDHSRRQDPEASLHLCEKILPARDEVRLNRRARSAVLRVAEKR